MDSLSGRQTPPPSGFKYVKTEIWEGVSADKNKKKPINKHKVRNQN